MENHEGVHIRFVSMCTDPIDLTSADVSPTGFYCLFVTLIKLLVACVTVTLSVHSNCLPATPEGSINVVFYSFNEDSCWKSPPPKKKEFKLKFNFYRYCIFLVYFTICHDTML